MEIQYFCKNKLRLQAVQEHDSLNGIEYLEVLDKIAEDWGTPSGDLRQKTLMVRCVKPLTSLISSENVKILGGVRINNIQVEWAVRASDVYSFYVDKLISHNELDFYTNQPDPDQLLLVRTKSTGDFSTYTLHLVEEDKPHSEFDPLLAKIDFSFKVECPSDFDCLLEEICPSDKPKAIPIDYLAKDYASFRRLMLDRLSVVMPDWQERNPADLGVVLVELLAYAADHLSYYQDAVATEAYLGTARRRPSVRRHAYLLNYHMHDGCNARAWIVLTVETGVKNVLLQREYKKGQKTQLLTKINAGTSIYADDLEKIIGEQKPEFFELMHDIRLFDSHNDLYFYTWGDDNCCLPKGATQATLEDDKEKRLMLRRGDVLIFKERLGPATGQEADADPMHRHAVRLTHVDPEAKVDEYGNRTPGSLRLDELYNEAIVDIEWSVEDELPFPFCLSVVVEQDGEDVPYHHLSIAHGNVVLADHGRTVPSKKLPMPTGNRWYRPALKEPNITQRVEFFEKAWAKRPFNKFGWLSAKQALLQNPENALPDIKIQNIEEETWNPVRHLLESDRFDTHFVVETENDGNARLRFGDNIYGRRPEKGVELDAIYRIGTGPSGNVGSESIAHIVTTPGVGIKFVRNPMSAKGGTAPETLNEVKQYAPQAFRRQERAVTEEDYQDVAERHPEVQRAIARRLWTGSWHTMFITVDRKGGLPVDQEFENKLSAFIESYQLAGHDVEIEPPRFVPLDILLRVCVKAGYLRSDVKSALLERFSSRDLPDGSRGFFHPDNFTFNQSVYLSQIISTAMGVDGVRWIDMNPREDPPARFHRWGKAQYDEIDKGFILVGRLEIALCDNDPNFPENGRIEFFMEGGI